MARNRQLAAVPTTAAHVSREVARALAAGWVDGCEYNTASDLAEAIVVFAGKITSLVEILHGDDDAALIIEAFRDAAERAELELGNRIHRGIRNKREIK